MFGIRGTLFRLCREVHTVSRDGPSISLKKKIAEMEKKRKRSNPRKKELFVEVPESKSFLDTATMPMILTVVGTALVAKLLMMVHWIISFFFHRILVLSILLLHDDIAFYILIFVLPWLWARFLLYILLSTNPKWALFLRII